MNLDALELYRLYLAQVFTWPIAGLSHAGRAVATHSLGMPQSRSAERGQPNNLPMRDILKILEQDARATPARIAALTGRDEDEVARQIGIWEKSGVIRRYKTVIDWERFGDERVYAFIDVSVTPERGSGFDEIAGRIYRYPEVRSVALVSGGHDLRVIVEGLNIREIADFVAEKLATLDRVNSTDTHFLLKKYKEDGDVFAEADADQRLMVAP